MRLPVSFLFLVACLGLVPCGRAIAEDVAVPKEKETFHIYLLMGQSNMAGRGKVVPDENKPHARVLKLDKQNKWVPATDPLHFDKPTIAGVGPGSGFGPTMAEADKSATIGLVPCAFGGTPLKRWVKEGDLYQKAVKRARVAMAQGTLKGVIWHQGESDSKTLETAKSYGKRLSKMIIDLRTDLEAPELPFVVGNLGEFIKTERLPHIDVVNRALTAIPEAVPQTICVPSTGLKAKSDGIHFDAVSAREFGRRYAKAMLELQQQTAGENDTN